MWRASGGCGGKSNISTFPGALCYSASVHIQVSEILCVREYCQWLSLHSVEDLLVVGAL